MGMGVHEFVGHPTGRASDDDSRQPVNPPFGHGSTYDG